MMRLRNVVATIVIAAFVFATASTAHGDLQNDIRSSPNAAQFKSAIDAYVKSHVDKINGDDFKVAKESRDELSRQTDTTPNLTPSAAFQLTYTTSVAAALQPMLKSNEVGDRLTAAIITCRLSVATKLLSLQATTQQLLLDPSPAVALWGIKSAEMLLPTVLSGGLAASNQQLTTGIVTAVQNHPTSGPIIQDAYKALDVSGVTPALSPTSLNKATDAMNAILALRVQQWVEGVPVDAQADRDPTLYLWKVVKSNGPQQNMQSIQNLVDLLSVSAQRFSQAGGGDRDKFQKIAESAAGSILVIFRDDQAVVAAFKPFQRLGSMNAGQIQTQLLAGVGALRVVPAYAALKNPPDVKPLVQAAAGN